MHSLLARPAFLDEIVIDHGPAMILTEMFLRGDSEARNKGLMLSFENPHVVADVNWRHRDSWMPLFPTYDPEFWCGDEHNAFSIVGRNRQNEIVATQALRVFDWRRTNFAIEAEQLRLLYRDPAKHRLSNERCTVTAAQARRIDGRVSFSGGIWFRPDYRGHKLTGLMVRLGRAYAIARYNIDCNTALMSEAVFNMGLWRQVGHKHFDEWVELTGSRLGTFRLKLMWLSALEVVDDLVTYLAARDVRSVA